MRRLLVLLFILILSVWLGLKVAEDPGYALFVYRHWSLEMPLWFTVLSLIAILLVLYFLLRFFDSLDSAMYRFQNWLRWRKKHKAYSKTNRGLIELMEGHWRNAENYLLDGVQQSDAPLINYLSAAQAAHEQGAYDRRDSYLRKAHDFAPHAEIAIGLTQAQLKLNQGKLEQALATLDRLKSVSPYHPFVLKLLERVYIHLADWPNLIKLIPSLRKAKVIDAENLDKLELNAYKELLKNLSNKNLPNLHAIWNTVPRRLQKNPEMIACYVALLQNYPESSLEIDELITRAVKKSWNASLVHQYGLLRTSHPAKQLAIAETWLKRYDNHAVLLLTLGRLSERCQLWGKAKSYLEESLKLEAKAETYAEYGKLLEHLGDANAAMQSYRDGLRFIVMDS